MLSSRCRRTIGVRTEAHQRRRLAICARRQIREGGVETWTRNAPAENNPDCGAKKRSYGDTSYAASARTGRTVRHPHQSANSGAPGYAENASPNAAIGR